jgi:hypothetical protein
MMATMAMGETVMVTATATAMMPPPLPMERMSMTTTAAIQGRRLDNGNLTTTMEQR